MVRFSLCVIDLIGRWHVQTYAITVEQIIVPFVRSTFISKKLLTRPQFTLNGVDVELRTHKPRCSNYTRESTRRWRTSRDCREMSTDKIKRKMRSTCLRSPAACSPSCIGSTGVTLCDLKLFLNSETLWLWNKTNTIFRQWKSKAWIAFTIWRS